MFLEHALESVPIIVLPTMITKPEAQSLILIDNFKSPENFVALCLQAELLDFNIRLQTKIKTATAIVKLIVAYQKKALIISLTE